MDEPETTDRPSLVRPYTLTAGRTDSRVHLPLEAPVQIIVGGVSNQLAPDIQSRKMYVRSPTAAVCEVPSTSLDDVLADQPRLVAVAAEISEPGNAGTLIRIADAMGADAVVLVGNSVDPYNGKCLRASAGSIFAVPVVTETDAGGAVSALCRAGLQLLATTVDGEVSLDDADLSGPTAWLFGPESRGLPEELAAMATHRVRIPMSGGAESLNVAAAAAICLYQSSRANR